MSVIMAYKTKDKVYLGADNRLTRPDDTLVCDDEKKIIIVNGCVAVAFAGYYENQNTFQKRIHKLRNPDKLGVEDVLSHIKRMYRKYKFTKYKQDSKNALSVASSFIVVGKNKKNECCIYAWSYLDGKLEKEPTLTDMSLFKPHDVSMEICTKFYVKNIHGGYTDFIQRTVKDIADASKVVSPSGDIWTYDMTTDKSTLEHFS